MMNGYVADVGPLPDATRPEIKMSAARLDLGPFSAKPTRPRQGRLSRIGRTPLVKVRLLICRRWKNLWLKLEQFNPGGSIKDRTAYCLVADLEDRGRLGPGGTVVESTSGNLGIGLAMACSERGYRFIAVVDPNISEYSIEKMMELGAQIERVEAAAREGGHLASRLIRVKELLSRDPSIVWTNQYGNSANPRIHREQTGTELLRQTGTVPGIVFISVSTGGTLKGISEYLRPFAPDCLIAAVDIQGSVALGGRPGKRRIPGIGSTRRSEFLGDHPYDFASYISDAEAIATCHALRSCTGIGLGGSSGAVIAAAARYLSGEPKGGMVICICPDGSDRYEYSLYNQDWLDSREISLDVPGLVAFDDAACG